MTTPEPVAEPTRVALVITGLEVGGAEKCLTQLALHVGPEFSPHVFSLQARPSEAKGGLVHQLEQANVPIHFFGARSLLSFPLAVWWLWRALRRERIEVVQSFLFHANIVAVLAARLAGIRRVHVGIRVAEPSRWRGALESIVYTLAESHVYVSKSVRRAYRSRRTYFCSFTITNGVDPQPYLEAIPADLTSDHILPTTPVILFIGRLHEQKGLDWFFTCLPQLFERLPEHHVVLVGDGPLERQLREMAEQLQISQRVHFLLWRPDIPQLLKRCDVLVLPSRYEGMPNVVLEAMAAGVPAVTTKVQGVYELLGPWAKELTVPFGDTAALVDRIATLVADQPLRERVTTALSERVIEKFSYPIKVSCYQLTWSEPPRAAIAYPAGPSPRRDTPAPEADSI